MPNVLKNRVTIVGEKPALEAFEVTARAVPRRAGVDPNRELIIEHFCWDVLVPLPETILDAEPTSEVSIQRECWGTKWGAFESEPPEYNEDRTRLTYEYSTAFGPGELFWEKLVKRFPQFTFYVTVFGDYPSIDRFVASSEGFRFESGEEDIADEVGEELFDNHDDDVGENFLDVLAMMNAESE